jgi:hypothetical protein
MKMLLTITALFALAVPAAFAAPPDGRGKPETSDTASAAQSSTASPAQLCKEQLRTMGVASFRSTHAPTGNGRNAMGKCVSRQTQVVSQATENAAKTCKAERQSMGAEAFANQYGTNPNKRNAFGKCVSGKAQHQVEAQQQETLNAAKTCKAERQSMGAEAFANEYGTNPNKRNAFGKCVSQKAKQTS